MRKRCREQSCLQLPDAVCHRRGDDGRELGIAAMQARTTVALGVLVAMRTARRGVRMGLRRNVHCRMIGHLRQGGLHARSSFRRTAMRRRTCHPLNRKQKPCD